MRTRVFRLVARKSPSSCAPPRLQIEKTWSRRQWPSSSSSTSSPSRSCSRASLLRGHRVAGRHDQHERVGVERERLETWRARPRARAAARSSWPSCTRSTRCAVVSSRRRESQLREALLQRTDQARQHVRRHGRDHTDAQPSGRRGSRSPRAVSTKPSIATSAARAWGRISLARGREQHAPAVALEEARPEHRLGAAGPGATAPAG